MKTGLILLRIWSSDPSVSSDKKSIFETYSGIKSTNGEHRRVFTIGCYSVSTNQIYRLVSQWELFLVLANDKLAWNYPYINLRQRSVFHTFPLKLHFCWYRFSNWCLSLTFSLRRWGNIHDFNWSSESFSSVWKPFLVLDDLISHRENLFHVHQKGLLQK